MRDFKITKRLTNPTENLSRYFNEISKYEILTPEKEAELAFKVIEGDLDAKEKILKSNLRFVISVAKTYQIPGATLEDLISEGNKGLIEALEKFDPRTGFKFISYAIWHIRKNIFTYLGNHTRSIRIPLNINAEMRKYSSLEESFVSYHGREPSVDEMISIINDPDNGIFISDNTIETIKNNPKTIPLDIPSNNYEENYSPINYIESLEKTDESLNNDDIKKMIASILNELKPIEKKIIILRYGLDNHGEESNFKSIGEAMGKTTEWARTICRKAEKKIKVIVRRRKIKEMFF